MKHKQEWIKRNLHKYPGKSTDQQRQTQYLKSAWEQKQITYKWGTISLTIHSNSIRGNRRWNDSFKLMRQFPLPAKMEFQKPDLVSPWRQPKSQQNKQKNIPKTKLWNNDFSRHWISGNIREWSLRKRKQTEPPSNGSQITATGVCPQAAPGGEAEPEPLRGEGRALWVEEPELRAQWVQGCYSSQGGVPESRE